MPQQKGSFSNVFGRNSHSLRGCDPSVRSSSAIFRLSTQGFVPCADLKTIGFQEKCDGLRPSCTACQAAGQTCSYDPNAKKRGLPEGYVRGLEKLWALALSNIDGFEDTMLALLGATPDSAGRRSKLMSVWTNDGASETLHESWKTSRLFSALERMLSNPDVPTPQCHDKRQRDECDDLPDAKDNWGFRLVRSSTSLGPGVPRVVEPSTSPMNKRARLSLPGDSPPVPQSVKDLNTLQLPPQTPQLLDVYFAVTHTWFPIIAKHNILRASYFYANAPLSVSSVKTGSGDHAALWAILSYTVSQSKGNLRDGTAPLSKAKEFYSISRKLIPSENENYELGHAQALLLLTLVNIGLEDWTAAWLLGGQAVRMAISMGLGLQANNQRSDEMKQRKAVFLGCYVVDSLLSFRLNRNPCISPNDLSPVGRLEEDGLEEWNSWADVLPPIRGMESNNPPRRGPLLSLSSFNRLVDLASVLNRATQRSFDGHGAHLLAQQLFLELKQWDDRLPPGCRLVGPESIYPERHSALLPHQTYLCLTYIATLLWIYLRVVPKELSLHHSQRPFTEGAKKLLFRAIPMMSQHLENFPMCGLPPLFEVTLRTIAKQAHTLRDTIDPGTFPFTQWTEQLLRQTVELRSMWPVYNSLVFSIEHWNRPKDVTEPSSMGSQRRAGDFLGIESVSPGSFGEDAILMPEMGRQRGQSEIDHQGRESLLRGTTNQAYSNIGIRIPVDGHPMSPNDTALRNMDFTMIGNPLHQAADRSSNFLDKLAQTDGSELPVPSQTQPRRPTSSSMSDISSANAARSDRMSTGHGFAMDTPSPNLPESGGISSDIDSIFKDLAYLDTTEWANSREAGLKDFGFMDDSTFQAFCHDPDRLEGSQPLVHPSSIADIWPPPGFFPEAFQDNTNEAEEG